MDLHIETSMLMVALFPKKILRNIISHIWFSYDF